MLIGRDRHGEPCLLVNFDENTVTLFKEVRNLSWLGFRVPATIKHLSEEASKRYPNFVALQSTLRTYSQCRAKITPEAEPLLFGHLKGIHDQISEAFPYKSRSLAVRWHSKDLSHWVTTLSEKVFTLQVIL